MNPLHRKKPATLATAKELMQAVNKTASKGAERLQAVNKITKATTV